MCGTLHSISHVDALQLTTMLSPHQHANIDSPSSTSMPADCHLNTHLTALRPCCPLRRRETCRAGNEWGSVCHVDSWWAAWPVASATLTAKSPPEKTPNAQPNPLNGFTLTYENTPSYHTESINGSSPFWMIIPVQLGFGFYAKNLMRMMLLWNSLK